MREPIGIWSLATTTSTVGRFPELRISAICCWRLCTYRTPIAAASAPTRIATKKTLPGFILPPPFHLRAYRAPAVTERYRARDAEPTVGGPATLAPSTSCHDHSPQRAA